MHACEVANDRSVRRPAPLRRRFDRETGLPLSSSQEGRETRALPTDVASRGRPGKRGGSCQMAGQREISPGLGWGSSPPRRAHGRPRLRPMVAVKQKKPGRRAIPCKQAIPRGIVLLGTLGTERGTCQSPSDGGNCWLHSAARRPRGRLRHVRSSRQCRWSDFCAAQRLLIPRPS